MTLEKYLEILYTVYKEFYTRLDDYYEKSQFVTNTTGYIPVKFVADDGTLKILIKKVIRSYYEEPTIAYLLQEIYKPLLSNNYAVEGMYVYPLNSSVLADAMAYVEDYKELFTSLHKRKSFYSGNIRVTMESCEFSKEKDNRSLEITIDQGNYKTDHLYIDLDTKRLETVDEFYSEYLQKVIVPEEVIPETVKELAYSNNFPIDPLTEEEKTVHKWHAKEERGHQRVKERSMRRWLIF